MHEEIGVRRRDKRMHEEIGMRRRDKRMHEEIGMRRRGKRMHDGFEAALEFGDWNPGLLAYKLLRDLLHYFPLQDRPVG